MKRLVLPFSFVVIASCGGSGGSSTPTAPTAPSTFTVGGTVSGLGAGKSLVLQMNGAGNLSVSANGTFTFASPMNTGGAYKVTVQTQPVGQTCTITKESGTVGSANVVDVSIACSVAIAAEWTGTGSSVSAPINATAQVVWTFERVADNVAYYRPTGTASAVSPACSFAPSSGTLNPVTDGVLIVDYNATPPSYHGTGLTLWTATWTCPPQPPFVNGVAAAFFGGNAGPLGVEAAGEVTGDGTTIQGTATAGDVTLTWSFTRKGTR